MLMRLVSSQYAARYMEMLTRFIQARTGESRSKNRTRKAKSTLAATNITRRVVIQNAWRVILLVLAHADKGGDVGGDSRWAVI